MRRLFASLTNRIFLATALLAVMTIAIAIYIVNVAVTAQAEQELERGLEEAASLVEESRSLLLSQLAQQARLVADLPKFKATVELDHPPTLERQASDYMEEITSDIFLVTNRRGRVLANLGIDPVALNELSNSSTVRAALDRHEGVNFLPWEGGVLQVVSVPIWIDPAAPEVLGTLTVGLDLSRAFANRLKALTNSEIAFRWDASVWTGTLEEADLSALAALPKSRISELRIGTDDYVAVSRPLTKALRPAIDEPSLPATPAESSPEIVILRSRTERLRFLGSLQNTLAAMAGLAVLAATLISYAVARTITRPLASITATMREMAATGDFTRRIPAQGSDRWSDEDAQVLATTFNALTTSIASFQQEATLRERLSSLGRLSTVLAHEIRNPLMIIKAAVRTLRRRAPSEEPHQAALTDIDEEIARLNRLVDEVLDFARPIRFSLAPADIVQICESAGTAATAGEPSPEIQVVSYLDETRFVTDAERLRLALVNVVANARQAVLGRDSATELEAGSSPITITIDPRPEGGVRIRVRDRGVGIPAAVLPRIFEPFFTTKRAGSGIGLAITRNIIEGLGGQITASSMPSEGTEIRIELPHEPPRALQATA